VQGFLECVFSEHIHRRSFALFLAIDLREALHYLFSDSEWVNFLQNFLK